MIRNGVTQQQNQTQIEAPVSNLILPQKYVGFFKKLDTTPSILNFEHAVFENTSAVNVTNFLKGQNGQHLNLLGDGFTTLVFGAKLKTNTGADKLLAANKVYRLTLFNGVWIEDA